MRITRDQNGDLRGFCFPEVRAVKLSGTEMEKAGPKGIAIEKLESTR